MKKIGISEPDAFVKSLFENQQIKYLSSSCFAQYYLNNLEEDIDDNLNRNGLCDLSVNFVFEFVSFKKCILN